MLARSHWDVLDYVSLGDTALSDPVRLDRDERAFCLLRSRYDRLANVELLYGWHESEETGWRWTAREFAVRVRGARMIEMQLWVAEESVRRLGPITLRSWADGRELEPAVYDTPGLAMYSRALQGSGEVEVRFCLDKALPPDSTDDRERGVIVARIGVE